MVTPPALGNAPAAVTANGSLENGPVRVGAAGLAGGSPLDWPADGPIDLTVHDLPHSSSGVEWWYVHAHLATPEGKTYGFFASFFRVVTGQDPVSKRLNYGHFLTWSLTDTEKKACYTDSRLELSFLPLALERIKKGSGSRDPRIRRALEESLGRGVFPRPDRAFDGPVHVATDRLALDFHNATFEKEGEGTYHITCGKDKVRADLRFTLELPPVRHGENGRVHGREGEDMFYYFVPRTGIEGTLELNGQSVKVSGRGWYDHEFGGHRHAADPTQDPRRDSAWNWCGIQLQDGSTVTFYEMVEAAGGKPIQSTALRISPEGERRSGPATLTPSRWWRGVRTFETYPTVWVLDAPTLGISLTLSATVDDQELITVISKPSFWEGECRVEGHLDGRPVEGLAYVERSGFSSFDTLDDFFRSVSEEVRKSVATLLPLRPTPKEAADLFASPKHTHLLEGLDINEIADTLIRPIRTITDRGGKAWRSYAALACCEALGADCRPYAKWLSLPEILHSGSLIIDDVEDRSDVRRGGLPAHKIFGEPIAINAGTAAFFLAEGTLTRMEGQDKKVLKLIEYYFEGLRAGHAGQALDLRGFDELVQEAVVTGDVSRLEGRVIGMHRLKTGAPAGILARMGAVAADGTPEQEEALGRFFESLGVAFQIVDDVLNLQGFEGKLKVVAEDITAGKVTLPLVIALGRLDTDGRVALVKVLRSGTKDPVILRQTVSVLERVGALEDCHKRAQALVDSSWAAVEPLLPESLSKVMLRAFCWYVLERHY